KLRDSALLLRFASVTYFFVRARRQIRKRLDLLVSNQRNINYNKLRDSACFPRRKPIIKEI
ncbi:MAG TPA: hypothetical protein DD415_00395, partial [Clostridiales bacterium]|nr:hypothetical protein [Clostridiales bacterium]